MTAATSAALFEINVPNWLHLNQHPAPVRVSEPIEVAYFSCPSGRLDSGSRAELKQFVQPPTRIDLNEGIDSFIFKTSNNAPVETIIQSVNHQISDALEGADIVTYRYNLNKIGNTPYDMQTPWEFDSCATQHTVFLDNRPRHEDPSAGHQFNLMYHGYRFEAVCTGSQHQPVDATSSFCSISQSKLAEHRILLAAEIDCSENDPNMTERAIRGYIELKVTIPPNPRNSDRVYNDRYRKYWLQSFLGGVRTIVVGYRTHDGLLLNVERMRTEDLPSEAIRYTSSRGIACWQSSVILYFLDYVLCRVREACTQRMGQTIRVCFSPADRTIRAFVVAQTNEGLGARLAKSLPK